MLYHQLSEVFGHLITLNMATLAFYERALEVIKQERSRMFEMWFDGEIDLQLLDFIENIVLEPSAKSDKILIVLMELNEKIETWLKSISSAIINSDAREYIQDLINYLSQTNQQIMHGLQRMDDV
jgi:CHASE3 domain sensor protein